MDFCPARATTFVDVFARFLRKICSCGFEVLPIFFAYVHKTLQNFHTLCGKVTNKAGLLRQLPHKQLATKPKVWYNTAKHKISCKSNTEFL